MATDNIDILLDSDFEDSIVGGDYAIGDGTLDDCQVIFKLNTGALKSDPILGPNMVKMINSRKTPSEIKQILKLNLNRDSKYPRTLEIINGFVNIQM